ncbi:hypothetical protein Poli38472_008350 [Pythium oligandrum]|uniref:Uncharacterized protein n=1 Tax=Pythium oligandrum TaxID=41045 RepID=A0A8K1CNW3_PYTOL|nr:hypothetical protein Poli38472_008350 [Pythium oligandrum]|eukprot:TMW65708.1 hypothetical protein Poli38472_008350 [Pythium oligandrum]
MQANAPKMPRKTRRDRRTCMVDEKMEAKLKEQLRRAHKKEMARMDDEHQREVLQERIVQLEEEKERLQKRLASTKRIIAKVIVAKLLYMAKSAAGIDSFADLIDDADADKDALAHKANELKRDGQKLMSDPDFQYLLRSNLVSKATQDK